MGALTLGFVLPAGPSREPGSKGDRARSAESGWTEAERRSAADLAETAMALGHSVEFVVVPALSDDPHPDLGPIMDVMRRRLTGVSRVLIMSHGELGGSGRLHAAARACNLPVLGPEASAIELAFDKLRARARLSQRNLPVPPSVQLQELALASTDTDLLGWPCVLKPRRGVAGTGVQRLANAAQLEAARATARPDALLEREIEGREVSAVVLHQRVLGLAEFERGGWDEQRGAVVTCPARVDRFERTGLENLALRACAALGLGESPTRVDFMISERGNEVVLEVEPLPPLHRDGLVARVARAAGYSYPRLCGELLAGRPLTPPARRRLSVGARPAQPSL